VVNEKRASYSLEAACWPFAGAVAEVRRLSAKWPSAVQCVRLNVGWSTFPVRKLFLVSETIHKEVLLAVLVSRDCKSLVFHPAIHLLVHLVFGCICSVPAIGTGH